MKKVISQVIMMYEFGQSVKRDKKIEKSNYEKVAKSITRLLALIGFITPLFFLCGESFYKGYFKAYELPINDFPLTVSETYTFAYSASTYFAVPMFFFLIKILIVAVGVLYISVFVVFKISKAYENHRTKIDSYKQTTAYFQLKQFSSTNKVHLIRVDRVLGLGQVILQLLIVAIVFVFLWIWIPHMFYQQGIESQQATIQKYMEKGCYFQEADQNNVHWNNCTKIIDQNGTKYYEGLLVANSGNKIAMFVHGQSILFSSQPNYIIMQENNATTSTTEKEG